MIISNSINFYEMRFYDKYDKVLFNTTAAEFVVPYLLKEIEPIIISSVIDFGCGIGTWLSTFKKYGAIDVLGLDGLHVNKNELLIESIEFRSEDLTANKTEIDKKFDLAVSLEVAEHLAPEFAKLFISNLTNSSDIVLFSAAIPGQGGFEHVNCQWPSYWVDIFNSFGFEVIDIIRPELLKIDKIEYWYKQNILLFTNNSSLLNKYKNQKGKFMEIASRELYQNKIDELKNINDGTLGINYGFKVLGKAIKNKIFRK